MLNAEWKSQELLAGTWQSFGLKNKKKKSQIIHDVCRLHTAFLHWPLSSAATKEVQGPDTT
jgi:hypothetical protein